MPMLPTTFRYFLLVLTLVAGQALAQGKPTFVELGSRTKSIADPYFKSYVARDWARLEPMLADDAGFSDATASLVFGSVKFEGKSATLKNFREGYAAIKQMKFHQIRSFVSGEHAIYEGTLDWTLELEGGKQAVTEGMPFITVLRVVEGRILEHQDFADYTPFVAALRAARAGG